jgi:hypothetical protein
MNFRLPSAEDHVDFVRITVAPLSVVMTHLPAARQEKIRNMVVDAARKQSDSTGSVNFTTEVICASAKR